MDKQHLRLVEAQAAINDLDELQRADNPAVSAEIGYGAEEDLIRIASMPIGVAEVAEVLAESTPEVSPEGERFILFMGVTELTPDQEERLDHLAEIHHNYADAYRQLMQEIGSSRAA